MTMDGDLQNDPADIPRLLDKLDRGLRRGLGLAPQPPGRLLTRKLPSWIANRLIARITGVPLHDLRLHAQGLPPRGARRASGSTARCTGSSRSSPAGKGRASTELVVNHRPRTAGRTKYGLGRTFNVVLDLILIRFFQRVRPAAHAPVRPHRDLVDVAQLPLLRRDALLQVPATSWSACPRKTFVETPLPLAVIQFFLTGVMSILMGVLAEMVMRTYYESQSKTTYLLGEIRQGPAEVRPKE